MTIAGIRGDREREKVLETEGTIRLFKCRPLEEIRISVAPKNPPRCYDMVKHDHLDVPFQVKFIVEYVSMWY